MFDYVELLEHELLGKAYAQNCTRNRTWTKRLLMYEEGSFHFFTNSKNECSVTLFLTFIWFDSYRNIILSSILIKKKNESTMWGIEIGSKTRAAVLHCVFMKSRKVSRNIPNLIIWSTLRLPRRYYCHKGWLLYVSLNYGCWTWIYCFLHVLKDS